MSKLIDISTPTYPNQFTIVDDNDFKELNKHRWQATKHGYPKAYLKKKYGGKRVLLHRFIMQAKSGEYVDHIDGNILNNTRENLRICTKRENEMNRPKQANNTTGYKGVRLHKETGMFFVSIWSKNKQYYIGLYKTKEIAAVAYNIAARILHKEFANLNQVINEKEIINTIESKVIKHLSKRYV